MSAVGLVAVAGVTLSSGVASAAGEAATGTRVTSAAAKCATQKVVAKESVKIRKSRKLNSTALGLFPKGKSGKRAMCGIVEIGQSYKLCGWDEDNRWDYINYNGTKGWVPLACIDWPA